jgi:hypothetical protein
MGSFTGNSAKRQQGAITTEKGKIINTGVGGFLCPPGHPMLTKSVQTDLRRPENRSCLSLEYAAESPVLDDATRAAARTVLAAWQKPALDAPEVQEWILQVLGYFKGCFNLSGEESGWEASKLTIDWAADPLLNADCHAGVHLIRKYYPVFRPTADHFANAYWGTKPQ